MVEFIPNGDRSVRHKVRNGWDNKHYVDIGPWRTYELHVSPRLRIPHVIIGGYVHTGTLRVKAGSDKHG